MKSIALLLVLLLAMRANTQASCTPDPSCDTGVAGQDQCCTCYPDPPYFGECCTSCPNGIPGGSYFLVPTECTCYPCAGDENCISCSYQNQFCTDCQDGWTLDPDTFLCDPDDDRRRLASSASSGSNKCSLGFAQDSNGNCNHLSATYLILSLNVNNGVYINGACPHSHSSLNLADYAAGKAVLPRNVAASDLTVKILKYLTNPKSGVNIACLPRGDNRNLAATVVTGASSNIIQTVTVVGALFVAAALVMIGMRKVKSTPVQEAPSTPKAITTH
jgi:hypothetical protein